MSIVARERPSSITRSRPSSIVADERWLVLRDDTDRPAREIGLPLVRAEALNDDPLVLQAMVDVVRATHRRYARGLSISAREEAGHDGGAVRP